MADKSRLPQQHVDVWLHAEKRCVCNVDIADLVDACEHYAASWMRKKPEPPSEAAPVHTAEEIAAREIVGLVISAASFLLRCRPGMDHRQSTRTARFHRTPNSSPSARPSLHRGTYRPT